MLALAIDVEDADSLGADFHCISGGGSGRKSFACRQGVLRRGRSIFEMTVVFKRFQWLFAISSCGMLLLGVPILKAETLVLPAEGEIFHAEIYVWRGDKSDRWRSSTRTTKSSRPGLQRSSLPKGVLVLCPGQNGSSESMVQSAAWREFAAREGLDLVGLRFVSSDEDLKNGRGYFVASRGSGALEPV